MKNFTNKEIKLLHSLKTPAKIQDFINSIPINFENDGETCRSPLETLRAGKAHCIEGAFLAAYILSLHGHKPLLLDLKVANSNDNDFDHVVTLFKHNGCWGAISKTNHSVLRYREPIYKTVRELALSYFHEYITDDGKKNLRSYSKPFDISKFDTRNWATDPDNLWYIALALDASPHEQILNSQMIRNLRKADKIEIEAGKITEWKKKK